MLNRELSSSAQTIIDELRQLRTKWYEAEFDFYHAAQEIEQNRRSEWRQDFVTFDELLDHADICNSSRYRAFLEACKLLGKEKVLFIGIAAAIAAARHQNASERTKMVEHFEMSRKDNGKPLSERQVKSVQIRLAEEARESGYAQRAAKRAEREQELYKEVLELRKKVRTLMSENASLRERLAKYDGAAASKKGGARKSSSKHAEG